MPRGGAKRLSKREKSTVKRYRSYTKNIGANYKKRKMGKLPSSEKIGGMWSGLEKSEYKSKGAKKEVRVISVGVKVGGTYPDP